jgi:hypothetical protein
MGVFASGREAPVTVPQPPVRCPTAVLDDFGWRCEAPGPMAADLRGIALGPGAFAEDAAGLGVAGCGQGPLSAWRPGGVC